MSIQSHLDRIIGHLGAAAAQLTWYDDEIIGGHIEDALALAVELKAEFTKQGNGQ